MSEPPDCILVVDDEATNRLLLERILTRAGYAVVTAEDGHRALEIIEQSPVSMVLLDVMMPGIDGLEVLRRLRARHAPSMLPVIMATARHETEDIVRALDLGANDYVGKPLDIPVVLARVRTHLALRRATNDLESARRRMARDLEAAARIQRALLPGSAPTLPGVTLAWAFRPCAELAGDMLNAFALDERSVALYLIDVSGHGAPAALLSVTLGHLLAPIPDNPLVYAASGPDGAGPRRPRGPVEVADRLNDRFRVGPGNAQYFTLAYGILDVRTRVLRYVSAGHPGPIHVSERAGAVVEPSEDLPIGWSRTPGFTEHRLSLAPGDRVYMYSDGVIEARNDDGEPFGSPRLRDLALACGSGSLQDAVDRISGAVDAWSGAPLADDLSLLAMEVGGILPDHVPSP